MTLRLTIDRHDLHRTRWEEAPARALADGEARLRIARVALTANNITYAAFGDAMHYCDGSGADSGRQAQVDVSSAQSHDLS